MQRGQVERYLAKPIYDIQTGGTSCNNSNLTQQKQAYRGSFTIGIVRISAK